MKTVLLFRHNRLVYQLAVGALILMGLLSIATGAPFARAASAAQGANFALQPVTYDPSVPATKSYFIFDSKPGATLQNRVRISNVGTETGTANLYAVDATTGQTSGAVYLSKSSVRNDVGAWITIQTPQVTLAPGQSQVIPFQVTIPATVRSGQHLGGIVAENSVAIKSTSKSALQVSVQNLTVTAVQINLPGSRVEQIIVTGVTVGGANNYQSVVVTLSNTGNVMLKSTGILKVTDKQGRLLYTLPVKLDTFLPDTSINFPVYIQGQALVAGNYHASLTLQYGNSQTLSYSTGFTVTQQQLAQVFKSSGPTQLPGAAGFLSSTPLWELVIGALFLLTSLLYLGPKLYHLASHPFLKSRTKA